MHIAFLEISASLSLQAFCDMRHIYAVFSMIGLLIRSDPSKYQIRGTGVYVVVTTGEYQCRPAFQVLVDCNTASPVSA